MSPNRRQSIEVSKRGLVARQEAFSTATPESYSVSSKATSSSLDSLLSPNRRPSIELLKRGAAG
jgi:hypothetical protein